MLYPCATDILLSSIAPGTSKLTMKDTHFLEQYQTYILVLLTSWIQFNVMHLFEVTNSFNQCKHFAKSNCSIFILKSNSSLCVFQPSFLSMLCFLSFYWFWPVQSSVYTYKSYVHTHIFQNITVDVVFIANFARNNLMGWFVIFKVYWKVMDSHEGNGLRWHLVTSKWPLLPSTLCDLMKPDCIKPLPEPMLTPRRILW